MKRLLAVLVGAGLAVGGGVAAWAAPDGANRAAVKDCRAQAKADNPGADRATLKQAVRDCLAAQGITVPNPSPEQKAKIEAFRTCLQGVKAANPDADRAQLRDLAKPCFDQAGITPGQLHPRLAKLRECRAEVRSQHPDADKTQARQLVKECVQAS